MGKSRRLFLYQKIEEIFSLEIKMAKIHLLFALDGLEVPLRPPQPRITTSKILH